MPLVLVSNDANATDRYDWKDITGVQYHYPNGYRNMIHEGEPFIYYRGIRRADGSRGQAEYFGYGVIAEVWRDEDIPLDTAKRNWAWYCAIHNYRPFDPPISAKINGVFFEDIPRNRWRNGVRSIDASVFQRILAAAAMANKTARVVWAMLTRNEASSPPGRQPLKAPPGRTRIARVMMM